MMNYYTGPVTEDEMGLVADLLGISESDFVALEEDVQAEGIGSRVGAWLAKAKEHFGGDVAKSAAKLSGRGTTTLSRADKISQAREKIQAALRQGTHDIPSAAEFARGQMHSSKPRKGWERRAEKDSAEFARKNRKSAYKTKKEKEEERIKSTPASKLLAPPEEPKSKPGELPKFRRPMPRMPPPGERLQLKPVQREDYRPFYGPRVQRLIETLRS